MNWVQEINLKSIEMLFDDDVLFSLIQFTLLANITDLDVLHNVLSKLSGQCSYRFDVRWNVMNDEEPLSDPNSILSKTFEQFKGPMTIDLELSLEGNHYSIRAMTLPRIDPSFSIFLFRKAMCR